MSNHTALIQDLFANITREGWSTKFNDALADDLVWVATGSSPVAGTYEGKQVYLEKIIKRLGARLGWTKFGFTRLTGRPQTLYLPVATALSLIA
jgi:ketosteroid isomerase-like protein